MPCTASRCFSLLYVGYVVRVTVLVIVLVTTTVEVIVGMSRRVILLVIVLEILNVLVIEEYEYKGCGDCASLFMQGGLKAQFLSQVRNRARPLYPHVRLCPHLPLSIPTSSSILAYISFISLLYSLYILRFLRIPAYHSGSLMELNRLW